MTTLLLRLAAPLQSWGTSSRFVRRNTDRVPSRSGIIGLLAAAKGLKRTDPLDELLPLKIGIRVEQPGRLERDFHTAHTRDGVHSMPLSYRFYLADAVFLVAVQGETKSLEGLRSALRRPVYPLFLGRRSCPPAGRLDYGLREEDIASVLEKAPWLASPWVQKNCHEKVVRLDIVQDCSPNEPGADLVRDDPISFDPRHRNYGWRTVLRDKVPIPNPLFQGEKDSLVSTIDPLDPMSSFEVIN